MEKKREKKKSNPLRWGRCEGQNSSAAVVTGKEGGFRRWVCLCRGGGSGSARGLHRWHWGRGGGRSGSPRPPSPSSGSPALCPPRSPRQRSCSRLPFRVLCHRHACERREVEILGSPEVIVMNRATPASVGARSAPGGAYRDASVQGGREAAALDRHHSGIGGTVSPLCACRGDGAAILLYG